MSAELAKVRARLVSLGCQVGEVDGGWVVVYPPSLKAKVEELTAPLSGIEVELREKKYVGVEYKLKPLNKNSSSPAAERAIAAVPERNVAALRGDLGGDNDDH